MVMRVIAMGVFFLLCFFLMIFGFAVISRAADITLVCQKPANATGVIVEQSVDQGQTWTQVITIPDCPWNVTVPDSTLVLIRFLAEYPNGVMPRTGAGAWYHSDWVLGVVQGGGIQ